MLYALGELAPQTAGEDYWTAPTAAVIGDVVLEKNVSVWWGAVLRGDNDRIAIGDNSNIQDGSTLHVDPGFPLTIGRDVTIGHMVMLHGCTIGDGSLIGMITRSDVVGFLTDHVEHEIAGGMFDTTRFRATEVERLLAAVKEIAG